MWSRQVSYPVVWPVDEVEVDGALLDEQRADRLEEREVAVEPDRQVLVGQRRADAR